MALPILRKSQIQPAGSSGSTSSGSTTSGGTVSATPAGGVKHAPYYSGGVFNRSVKLIVTTAGTPQAAEPMAVPTGGKTRIRTYEGNVGYMYFAESKEALRNGQGVELAAGYEIIFPYQVGRLWYMGQNDGDYAALSGRSE